MARRVLVFALLMLALGSACLAVPQKARELVNAADASVLVWIPSGQFTMGGDKGDPDELPSGMVDVKGFWMSEKEITNAQYAKFLEATGRSEPDLWNDANFNKPDQPVIGVRWPDAVAYCTWAGGRLPTEAEWEYAASAGKGLGDGTATGSLDHETANYAGARGRDTFEDVTSPVGSFPPNPFGLYDMAGNVWEWTSSAWMDYPYVASDGREDMDSGGFRVMRGGCYHFGEFHCRNTARHRHRYHLHYDYVGFRLAKSEDDVLAKQTPKLTADDEKLLDSLRGLYVLIEKSSIADRQSVTRRLNQFVQQVKTALPEAE